MKEKYLIHSWYASDKKKMYFTIAFLKGGQLSAKREKSTRYYCQDGRLARGNLLKTKLSFVNVSSVYSPSPGLVC